jgi:hypothetical protein
MALIKFGGGITAMSGSLAGQTYARNHYGNYVRARTKPVNKNTDRQIFARNVMKNTSELWSNSLTIEQRQSWNEFAANVPVTNKLGESITLSGFNQFCRSNAAILNAELTVVKDAPSTFTMPEVDPTIAATYVGSTGKISVAFDTDLAWVKEAGAALLVYQGAPQSPGVEFFNGPWRLVGNVPGVTSTGAESPAEFDSAYVLAAGQKCTCQFRIVRADGRLSEFFRAPAAIVT